MHDMKIRPADPGDYEAVGALTLQVYVGEGFIDPASPYVEDLADTGTRAASADIRVAMADGQLLGSLTIARPGTPYADIARPGELEFRMLAVDKRARGAGVGAALVNTVLDVARAEGYEQVVLTTMLPMVDAQRLYQRMGFERATERDWSTAAGKPLQVMRFALSPAR